MTRALAQSLLLFLAPFLAYGLWRLLRRGRGASDAGRPWLALAAAGLALVCAGFVWLATTGGDPPGGTYVPARLDPATGRVVPGEVRRPTDGGS